jgi:hypothetical protein
VTGVQTCALPISRDAWNHGKDAGISVSMSKGTTSKETVRTRSYDKQLFLWAHSLNVWVATRISFSLKVRDHVLQPYKCFPRLNGMGGQTRSRFHEEGRGITCLTKELSVTEKANGFSTCHDGSFNVVS